MNCELPNVQGGFRKGRGTRDQIANIRWIIEKAREFQKNIYFCFIDYTKAFDCVDHNKLWEILQKMRIPGHLTWLLTSIIAVEKSSFTVIAIPLRLSFLLSGCVVKQSFPRLVFISFPIRCLSAVKKKKKKSIHLRIHWAPKT